ncbi:MAG: hypothetical protein ACOCTU_04500 [Bacteroidota bacterium]
MALTDKDIEQIEDYLLGKITDEAKRQIEERIKTDPDFAEEVEFMRDVILATRGKGREETDKILKETQQEARPEEEGKPEKEMKKQIGSWKRKILNILQKRIKRLIKI